MNANVLKTGYLNAMARIARVGALGIALGLLPAASALALDSTTTQPLEPLGGSISLPQPPRALCPTLEKQCLRKCPPSNPLFPSYCELGCAIQKADCESGFIGFDYQCNAPKGAGCL